MSYRIRYRAPGDRLITSLLDWFETRAEAEAAMLEEKNARSKSETHANKGGHPDSVWWVEEVGLMSRIGRRALAPMVATVVASVVVLFAWGLWDSYKHKDDPTGYTAAHPFAAHEWGLLRKWDLEDGGNRVGFCQDLQERFSGRWWNARPGSVKICMHDSKGAISGPPFGPPTLSPAEFENPATVIPPFPAAAKRRIEHEGALVTYIVLSITALIIGGLIVMSMVLSWRVRRVQRNNQAQRSVGK
ncbi:MAG: hypothetical protein WBC67_17815 [Candidatus Acidiferrales bacterium]